MGADALIRAAVALAAFAPALCWLAPPSSPIAAVIAASLAIAASLHGLGRAVGWLVGDEDAPCALAIGWGLAAYLALGGWLGALGVFDVGTQRVFHVAATALGAAWCGARSIEWRAPRPRWWWLAPAVAVAAVAIHVVGAAGTWVGPFSDGEAHLLGPLRRLATTGALDDPFALPRTAGLGGNAILHALGSAFADARMIHAIDRGLALGLVAALAFTGTARGPARVLVLFTIVGLASGIPEFAVDLAPRWTLVALVFALHQSLVRAGAGARAMAPALLVAAALAAIRHGGVGALAVVAAATAARAAPGARGRALAGAALIAVVALGGHLGSALVASAGEPAAPAVLAILWRGAALRLALWGSLALVAYALARVAIRGHGDRGRELTIAATCAAAALAGPLSPAPAVWLVVQPLGIALVLLVVEPMLAARADDAWSPPPPAAVAVVGLALAFAVLRFPLGRPPLSWEDRLGRLVEAGRALAASRPGADDVEGNDYAAALRTVPPGARIGLWVDRPDRIDYRGRTIVDLHTPASAACTAAPPRGLAGPLPVRVSCRQLAALLPRLDLDYLLISPAAAPSPDGWRPRPWCYASAAGCEDPLTAFVGAAHRQGAGPVEVVDLRAP